MGALPAKARRTITHDNGGEFARHETVTAATGVRAFFCDPHSPWQRGGIENANGLLRRDLPRKTSLGDYTDDDIDDVIPACAGTGSGTSTQRLENAWATEPRSRHSPPTSVSHLKSESSTYGHPFTRAEDDVELFEKMEQDLMVA